MCVLFSNGLSVSSPVDKVIKNLVVFASADPALNWIQGHGTSEDAGIILLKMREAEAAEASNSRGKAAKAKYVGSTINYISAWECSSISDTKCILILESRPIFAKSCLRFRAIQSRIQRGALLPTLPFRREERLSL